MRLHDYLRRLRIDINDDLNNVPKNVLPPTLDTLRRLHRAHREAFLFENLSIQAGGSISVELQDIERKFLDERRGGYCFEHNTLFAAALRELGYDVVAFLGRVRRGPPERWKRTHMVLRVELGSADASPDADGRVFLADV